MSTAPSIPCLPSEDWNAKIRARFVAASLVRVASPRATLIWSVFQKFCSATPRAFRASLVEGAWAAGASLLVMPIGTAIAINNLAKLKGEQSARSRRSPDSVNELKNRSERNCVYTSCNAIRPSKAASSDYMRLVNVRNTTQHNNIRYLALKGTRKRLKLIDFYLVIGLNLPNLTEPYYTIKI